MFPEVTLRYVWNMIALDGKSLFSTGYKPIVHEKFGNAGVNPFTIATIASSGLMTTYQNARSTGRSVGGRSPREYRVRQVPSVYAKTTRFRAGASDKAERAKRPTTYRPVASE